MHMMLLEIDEEVLDVRNHVNLRFMMLETKLKFNPFLMSDARRILFQCEDYGFT